MRARRAHGGSPRRRAAAGALACLAALLAGACGSGPRQDENEEEATYRVRVVRATFPERQQLAERSDLLIAVENVGSRVIPNVAVTLDGLYRRLGGPESSDPERPVFVINGVRKSIAGFPETKEAAPGGGATALRDTWALGSLRPGERKVFRWSVTAVKAGPYRLEYTVSAGLDRKARAIDPSGRTPRGRFDGTVSDAAPDARVADDGETVIRGAP